MNKREKNMDTCNYLFKKGSKRRREQKMLSKNYRKYKINVHTNDSKTFPMFPYKLTQESAINDN